MKKYFTIDSDISWVDILSYFKPNVYTLLDSNNSNYTFAWDTEKALKQRVFCEGKLHQFQQKHKFNYIFGFLSFDTINKISEFNLSKKDLHEFPDSIFYIPKHVLIYKNNNLLYFGHESEYKIINELIKSKQKSIIFSTNKISLNNKTNFNEYNRKINSIKDHLQNGFIYEVNYCLEFSKINLLIDTENTYKKLKSKTKAPFSVLFKFNEIEVLSASPERFFMKKGNTIISQPIKGTSPRGKSKKDDDIIKNLLAKNTKEISENIMIVDLVRNDLSKIADNNSVKVKELCKIYSFETVHQLISTIKASITKSLTFEEISSSLFPMGSMTGAPKHSSLKVIYEYEDFKRSIYSGSIGYISPINNQDFNVVIRSILYNSDKKTLSIPVGGAITIKSTAQGEYNECLLKLESIKNSIVLKNLSST